MTYEEMQAYLGALTDAELIAAVREAGEDLTKAAAEQPGSEWHEACFAGAVAYSTEMSRRRLSLSTLH